MFRKGRSSLASVVVTFPETSAYNWKRDTQQLTMEQISRLKSSELAKG